MVSVVICTYNRSERLKKTLRSLKDMAVPESLNWEVIVVDNNSSDCTQGIVEEYEKTSQFPVRYFKEERQGLSFARNRGIEESEGEIIAFTDDDVIVDRNWLNRVRETFEEYDVACIGGKILPIWEKPKPDWLSEELYGFLALLDYGDEVIYMNTPSIWGANCAVKASVFEKYGGFNTELGRVRHKLYASEEVKFFEKLLENGERILYEPKAVVHHCIPKERLKKNYFRKWKFDEGELIGLLLGEYADRSVMGVPYYAIRILIVDVFSYFVMPTTRKDRFWSQLSIFKNLGFILGRLRY